MARVLVVDASGTHVQALGRSHQLEEHELTGCGGVLEAVQHIRTHAVDVIVTDPGTPIQEDLALVEEIKSLRPAIRTIVLAPALTNADVIDALRAQVFACFTPPFDHAEVAEMVRSAIAAADWRHAITPVSAVPHWLTLRVECGVMNADRLTRFLSEWRPDLPIDSRDLLMTALRELLLNAMEHGAGFDPQKVIEVTAARTDRAIVFHLRDPGDGFAPDHLPHAAATADPSQVTAVADHRVETGLRAGGFGLLIVRQVVDELIYNEKGNEVLMIKHID